MKIDYTIPVKIAYDLMDSRKAYADYQKEYIRVYRKYAFSKPWEIDLIKEWYSRLEFTWKEMCGIDKQLMACADMLGVNRFVFIRIARIYSVLYKDMKNPMEYLDSDDNNDIEKMIGILNDDNYNGECLSPSEIRVYIRKNQWDKLK